MRRFAGFLLAFVLSACATASFTTKSAATDARLSNQHLYIYSMLDLRASDFGVSMVSAVHDQLRARLGQHGVTTEIVTYADTLNGKPLTPQNGTVRIPLEQIISSHQAQEQTFGASYRLIVMPASMQISDMGQSYDVNWVLIQIPSNRVVWSSTLQGSRTVWWSQNEDAMRRAMTFVDGVIAQMESSGLFGDATPTSTPSLAPTT